MFLFDVHMLCLSALWIFSELFIINASCGLWMMLRLSLMILLCCIIESAGGLSVNVQDNDGFWLISNWNGENPCTFCKVFIAFWNQFRAISRLQWLSSGTLLSNSDSTKLCHSIIPFDQGDSAPVVCTFILRASHSIVSSSLTNSPPFSVKNLLTVPYTAPQYYLMAFTIWSGFSNGKIMVTENLVAWLIIWSKIFPL